MSSSERPFSRPYQTEKERLDTLAFTTFPEDYLPYTSSYHRKAPYLIWHDGQSSQKKCKRKCQWWCCCAQKPSPICNTKTIATIIILITLGILAAIAVSVYLGVLTKPHSSSILNLVGHLRIIEGDEFNSSLLNSSSKEFSAKANKYGIIIKNSLLKSSLKSALISVTIENFRENNLTVEFRISLDKRKSSFPEEDIADISKNILLEEILNDESGNFRDLQVDVDSLEIFEERIDEEKEEEESYKWSTVEPSFKFFTQNQSINNQNLNGAAIETKIFNSDHFSVTANDILSAVPSFTTSSVHLQFSESISPTFNRIIPSLSSSSLDNAVSNHRDSEELIKYGYDEWKPLIPTPEFSFEQETVIVSLEGNTQPSSNKKSLNSSRNENGPFLENLRRMDVEDQLEITSHEDVSVQITENAEFEGLSTSFSDGIFITQGIDNFPKTNSIWKPKGFEDLRTTLSPLNSNESKISNSSWNVSNLSNKYRMDDLEINVPSIISSSIHLQTSSFYNTNVSPLYNHPLYSDINISSEYETTFHSQPSSVTNVTPSRSSSMFESTFVFSDIVPTTTRDVYVITLYSDDISSKDSSQVNFNFQRENSKKSNFPFQSIVKANDSLSDQTYNSDESSVYTFEISRQSKVEPSRKVILSSESLSSTLTPVYHPSTSRSSGLEFSFEKNLSLLETATVPLSAGLPKVIPSAQYFKPGQNNFYDRESPGNLDSTKFDVNKVFVMDKAQKLENMPYFDMDYLENITDVNYLENSSEAILNQSGCGSDKFQCFAQQCVPLASRCNRIIECSNYRDEEGCTCADYLIALGQPQKLCDGIVDCWDHSDEKNCSWCAPDQFLCAEAKQCVNISQVCDGNHDCPFGIDERHCVTLGENEEDASRLNYKSEGYLMVKKLGQWGKLCLNNLKSWTNKNILKWKLEEMGKAVCTALTYRELASVQQIKDRNKNSSYFEISAPGDSQEARSVSMFQPSKCHSKEVIHVTCKSLECGLRPISFRHRIIGGESTGSGSWPWQVALYKEGEFQCGAVLINDFWLLSAGHCFYSSMNAYWTARLGVLRRGSELKSPYEIIRRITHIILHPDYVDKGFINDITLLRLDKEVPFSNYIRPICLPGLDDDVRKWNGQLCSVIGWGKLHEIGHTFPDTLHEVSLPIISTDDCKKRTIFLPIYKITDNMFCAGFERGGRDACLGDSGGPMMCQGEDGHWKLMGITSNGDGCGRRGRPGVYTKVGNYLTWIDSILNDVLPVETASLCQGHRCPLGRCLAAESVCDGKMDCSDGSDENGCVFN